MIENCFYLELLLSIFQSLAMIELADCLTVSWAQYSPHPYPMLDRADTSLSLRSTLYSIAEPSPHPPDIQGPAMSSPRYGEQLVSLEFRKCKKI